MTKIDRDKFNYPLPKNFKYSNDVKNRSMSEEFAAETDVNEVRKQNQQSQMNKTNTFRGASSYNNLSQ
ncbi:gamma-type small acid-soluble spore protein [Sporosarcina sp. UB5]|uniref:gamma-type small acid-soluble spore protein n=1 Tax=Sporosarcina sp. UB5 TaxID=3047463 RepID=UPI003D7B2B7B